MKKNTWNPIRRNRNIGTKNSGYSSDNKFVVPEKWSDCKVFWERLESPVACPFVINGCNLTLLVEPTKQGYVHACTPKDIERVLSLINREHLAEIDLVVLRQPKKKEEILKPVWGRFVYYADIGKYSGPGVYLEALAIKTVIKWSKKLSPFNKKELDALEADGHKIEKVKRGYNVHTSPESVRATQLYRTLPHEIGHAVDYLQNSLDPSINAATEEDSDYISRVFDSKTSLDKEEFANRYAREFFEKNNSNGELPFDREYNKEDLLSLKLQYEWFY